MDGQDCNSSVHVHESMQERIRSAVNISNSKFYKPLTLTCTLLTVPYRQSHTPYSYDPPAPTCTVNISYSNPYLPLTLT